MRELIIGWRTNLVPTTLAGFPPAIFLGIYMNLSAFYFLDRFYQPIIILGESNELFAGMDEQKLCLSVRFMEEEKAT